MPKICQKSLRAKNLPAKNLPKIWYSQKSFMSDILSRQFFGQKSFTN